MVACGLAVHLYAAAVMFNGPAGSEATPVHFLGGTVALLDLGGAWLLSDDVQLDVAYSAGLNRRSPDHGVTVGLSARF